MKKEIFQKEPSLRSKSTTSFCLRSICLSIAAHLATE